MARNRSRLGLVLLLSAALRALWGQRGVQPVAVFQHAAFTGTRAAGGSVPKTGRSFAKAMTATGSTPEKGATETQTVWYSLKGKVDKVKVALDCDVADLRLAIKESNKRKLGHVDANDLIVKTGQKGEALDPTDEVPEQEYKEVDGKPLLFYIEIDEPKINDAGVSEASLSEVVMDDLPEQAFFADGTGLLDKDERYVSPLGLWEEVWRHLSRHRRFYIRGAPRTGKSRFLNWVEQKQRELGCGKVLLCKKFSEDDLEYFLLENDFKDVNGRASVGKLAEWSGTVLFDEAQLGFADARRDQERKNEGKSEESPLIGAALYLLLKEASQCRTVFTGVGQASAEGGSVTPVELKDHAAALVSVAPEEDVRSWLERRLQYFLPMKESEAIAFAEPMMQLCGTHVGLLQYVGSKLEESLTRDYGEAQKSFFQARAKLASMLKDPRTFTLLRCRALGMENGEPSDRATQVLSMVRACGNSSYMNEKGKIEPGWTGGAREREGLTKALYAPVLGSGGSERLQPIHSDAVMGPTCALQSEMMYLAANSAYPEFANWTWLQERWVADAPECVTDLALSFLSHMRAQELLAVSSPEKADIPEDAKRGKSSMQEEFAVFCEKEMGYYLWASNRRARREQRRGQPPEPDQMQVQREFYVQRCGDQPNCRLDFLIGPDLEEDGAVVAHFGLELLIRRTNKLKSRVFSKPTSKSLETHVQRAGKTYLKTAKACKKGYCTLLIATSGTASHEQEFTTFKHLCESMWNGNQTVKEALQNHERVLVALCPMGWQSWDVFSFTPPTATETNLSAAFERWEVKRQFLMYKIVNGTAVSARHFYPRPTEVWAQELVREGEKLELRGDAFKVKPEDDDVASLAQGIAVLKGYVDTSGSQLAMYSQNRIYSQNRAEEWQKLEKNQRLYENLFERPYGFVVPGSGA